MPTIIDSLVVELGLDPANLSKGAKAGIAQLNKLEQTTDKTSKDMRESGKVAAEFFTKIRNEAVAMFAVFTAGRGLKEFIADSVGSSAAAGRLAYNLGTTVETLSSWDEAARMAGAAAGEVGGSLQSLVTAFQTVEGRANLSRTFGQLGVDLTDAKGQLRDFNSLLPDLADAAKRLGPQVFSVLGSQAGLSQGLINFLEQGRAKIQSEHDNALHNAITGSDVTAAQQLQEDWHRLTDQSEKFGRSILTDLSPAIHDVLASISVWLDTNRDWIEHGIDGGIKELIASLRSFDWKGLGHDFDQIWTYLKAIDWKAIETRVDGFEGKLKRATDSVGGLKNASELFLGLWTAAKLAPLLAAVGATGPIGLLAITLGSVALAYERVSAAYKDLMDRKAANVDPASAATAARLDAAGKPFVPAGPDQSAPPGEYDDGLGNGSMGLWGKTMRYFRQMRTNAEAQAGGNAPANTAAAQGIFSDLEQKNGLPANLLDTLWQKESGRGTNMVSGAGAKGHFQFMDGTAKQYGVQNPFDLQQSANGAASYIHDLMQKYGGSVEKALAAYNWGPGNLDKDLKKYGNAWLDHAPSETQNYVASIGNTLQAAQQPTANVVHNHHTESHMHGDVNVTTRATDAQGVGREVGRVMADPRQLAAQSNSGLS